MSDKDRAVELKSGTKGQVLPSEVAEEHDPVVLLIEEWLADESGYDEEAWPELKHALERDRLSYRARFGGQ